MPTKPSYSIFPRCRRTSNKHDINHNFPAVGLHHKTSATASTELQGLRLFAFPNGTTSSSSNTFTLPPQQSPNTLISPFTLSIPTFSNPALKPTIPKKAITILDISTLNGASNHADQNEGTAVNPRHRRPILRLFSRHNAQRNSTTKRAARLFRDFSFPAHDDDNKENTFRNNKTSWGEESMVSPKTVEGATFGYARIVNVDGCDGKLVVEKRDCGLWSAGRKRSWEEYDADDKSVGEEEGNVYGETEDEEGGVRV